MCGYHALAVPVRSWLAEGWAYQVSVAQGEWSSPLVPVHPGEFCSVVRLREGVDRPVIVRPGVSLAGLTQAEFAGSADSRAAVLNAQLPVHGALVGFHGVQ
jgi:hypothetical protein